MLLVILILVPLIGIFILSIVLTYVKTNYIKLIKTTALLITIIDLIISLIVFILFDFSSKQFQFVQEHYHIGYFDFYFGVDGLSIYFILLTTLIMPIALISNWKSINENTMTFLIIMLLLETSLLIVFLIVDMLLFYIFFESILAPLFILIGIYGSNERVRASFYFFLYTLLGSLFMLLSIITMLSLIGSTDFYIVSKTNFLFLTQLFLFIGIFIAFAVKTPVIYLNSWLLKAHVESPLSGSIILAAIVLKLAVYGILRIILPLLPKAFMYYTYIIFIIGVITIIYASLSTIRTVDVKELIAYSSVCHAAVYLIGLFSNTIQGIEGGILLGLAHGFVSSGLFICAGGILYDRSHTRLIAYYRGLAQNLPLFSTLFFILCLGNCGVPLTLNFIGEFMSLYGVFERLSLAGILASSSIVFSAAYTIFMFNRISFGGTVSFFWNEYAPDLNKREFFMLFALVLFTVIFGIYSPPILDGLHYIVTSLVVNITDSMYLSFDALEPWSLFFQDNSTYQIEVLEGLHNIMFYLVILMTLAVLSMFSLAVYFFKNTPLIEKPNSTDFGNTGIWWVVGGFIAAISIWFLYNNLTKGSGDTGADIPVVTLVLDNSEMDVYKFSNIDHLQLATIKEPFHLYVSLEHDPKVVLDYIFMPNTEALHKMDGDIQQVIALEAEASRIYEMSVSTHSSDDPDAGLIELRVAKSYGLLIRNLEAVYRVYNPNYVSPVDWLWYED